MYVISPLLTYTITLSLHLVPNVMTFIINIFKTLIEGKNSWHACDTGRSFCMNLHHYGRIWRKNATWRWQWALPVRSNTLSNCAYQSPLFFWPAIRLFDITDDPSDPYNQRNTAAASYGQHWAHRASCTGGLKNYERPHMYSGICQSSLISQWWKAHDIIRKKLRVFRYLPS